MTGLFIDAHQHLFLAVESFFNPWHATMYSGAVFASGVIAVRSGGTTRARYHSGKQFPMGTRRAFSASRGLLLGGALDFAWHAIFGFEHQLDLLFSPPHLFLLTGLFFLITGPVRSALRRPDAATLSISCRC